MRFPWLAGAVVLLGGCVYDPHFRPGFTRCSSGGDCPGSLKCVQGICVTPDGAAGAPDTAIDSPPDEAPPADHPIAADEAGPDLAPDAREDAAVVPDAPPQEDAPAAPDVPSADASCDGGPACPCRDDPLCTNGPGDFCLSAAVDGGVDEYYSCVPGEASACLVEANATACPSGRRVCTILLSKPTCVPAL